MYANSLSSLAQKLYLGEYGNSEDQVKQAIADYEWVKENILYRFSNWGVPEQTLNQRRRETSTDSTSIQHLLQKIHRDMVR